MAPSQIRELCSNKAKSGHEWAILTVAALFAVLLACTIVLTLRSNEDLQLILVDSVKSELVASCYAARNIVYEDIDLFKEIDNQADLEANRSQWQATVARLRTLRDDVGAEYIYALKQVGESYWFIFDTDEEAETAGTVVTEYQLSPVHQRAFDGQYGADVMNVADEWGSYNTGAIPLYDGNELVGIVSVDTSDAFIERSRQTAGLYATALTVLLLFSLAGLLAILLLQIRRIRRMQAELFRVANNDVITGLRNRYYLFNRFDGLRGHLQASEQPFAAFFIDLDNFKQVNDRAGHDAGDELLQLIADYLRSCHSGQDEEGEVQALTARIGGDEFLQVLPGIADAVAARSAAEAMLKGFMAQSTLRRYIREFGIGLSIGVALFPLHSRDYIDLFKFADIAMYHAKHGGKNNCAVYDPSMGDSIEGEELSVR